MTPGTARRVLLALTFTRWFPVGLVVSLITLVGLERGLSVAESVSASAIAGLVVFTLELPTSGFADAFGRKPLLLAAGVVNVAAAMVYLFAHSLWMFALGSTLTGIFRALDSGPLEAWFVDTLHAAEPEAEVGTALSAQGTVFGVSITVGAVTSGALIWWHPIGSHSALALPIACWAVLNAVHLVVTALLMKEPRAHADVATARRALDSARETPSVIRSGLALLRERPVLRGLVGVEIFWAMAMTVFETFQPIRLFELLGSQEAAGRIMGPVAAGGWGVFALGSAAAGLASRHIGVARTAAAARVLNGLGAMVMGVVAGPVALVGAYLVTYTLHGSAGPVHATLLHREASARNRSTVLSLNSMASFGAFALVMPAMGVLAEHTSNQVAMVTAGAVSVLGVLLYLPAIRQDHRRQAATTSALGPSNGGP